MLANLVPVYFSERNEREKEEFNQQVKMLKETYKDVANFMDEVEVGGSIPKDADAIVFPQLIGAAFKKIEDLKKINKPFIVLTSKYATVEMWDWEIITHFRTHHLKVFSPYTIELAKVIIRAITTRKKLSQGGRFLMLQDSPGEGKQANIFKRFYWWEKECTAEMEKAFGIKLIYRSWEEVCASAKKIDDRQAKDICRQWDINREGVSETDYLRAVKLYIAVKDVINEIGDIQGVGSNCLNESFYSDSTPCLAWNMLFERDNIIWACEGDTLTLLSTFIIYRSLIQPIMMTNIYPFLVGMAALAHEKIDKFPDIADPDNHALGVHCGYFGLAPRCFCTEWTLRPKVLSIVDDNAIVIDCRFPIGKITLAKIHPSFKKIIVIEAEIEDYVQYPGSDCRNGALIRYKDGHKVMESLYSHHALIIAGDKRPELMQLSRVFNWDIEVL